MKPQSKTDQPKTDQETFDAVVKHFRQMPGPAGDLGHTEYKCYYRTEDGNKCFAGALIPDELYTTEMEGASAIKYLVREALAKAGYKNIALVRKLQWCHDSAASRARSLKTKAQRLHFWRQDCADKLIDLAQVHQLVVPHSLRRIRAGDNAELSPTINPPSLPTTT